MKSTTLDRMDVVIPVIGRDARRLRLLLRSMERYWHVAGEIFVVVPASELEAFHWVGPSVRLIAEEEIVDSRRKILGWYKNQMVKLGASAIVGTDMHMAVDADCMVTRSLSYVDCFQEEKMLAAFGKEDRFRFRICAWVNAAKLLKVSQDFIPGPAGLFTVVSPFFYARDLVEGMKERIERENGKSWIDVLADGIPEQHRFTAWTEMSLYHLHTLATGTWSFRYVGVPEFTHLIGIGACSPEQAEREFSVWCPEVTFGHEMFCNIQSTGCIDMERIETRVAPWLGSF